jgi:hypothetical protein
VPVPTPQDHFDKLPNTPISSKLEHVFPSSQCGISPEELTEIRDALAQVVVAATDSVLVDQIRLLEEIRAAATAAQAVTTAAFVASQRAQQAALGVPAERTGRGVAAQVGLARRMSPFQAARYVGQVVILTSELPATFACLASGLVPEWRALQVAQQTAWLSRENRLIVDAEVAPQLEHLGNRRTIDLTNKVAYRLDPRGYVNRLASAEGERHISLRPAPDCMARATALLPVQAAVAVYAELNSHAATVVGVGSETRNRGQVMADIFVERVTGQAQAKDVPIMVNLIMTDQTLFSTGDEPAYIVGGGTIPAPLARRMVNDPTGDAATFVRRLYTNAEGSQLAAMDSQSRFFSGNQRHFLVLRDQSCRTPWCDAPIRHSDHVQPAEADGPTSIANGQGLCEACNHTKQAPGWRQYVDPDQPSEIITVTPTDHEYRSRPPAPPGFAPTSTLEQQAHKPTRAAA